MALVFPAGARLNGPEPGTSGERTGERTGEAVTGTWIGVDVGTVRVGVAKSDPSGVLAIPVATLSRDKRGNRDVTDLAVLVAEARAVGVVVGLPRTLAGHEGSSAQLARQYATLLGRAIDPIPVHHVDERLTTVAATRKLISGGVHGSRAKRAVIDQAAAVEILQHWLDSLHG
jgi:putative Holliday junction resolvase